MLDVQLQRREGRGGGGGAVVSVLFVMFVAHSLAASYYGDLVFRPYFVGDPGQISICLGDTPESCVIQWVSSLRPDPGAVRYVSDNDVVGGNASVYYGQVSWELASLPRLNSSDSLLPYRYHQEDFASVYTEGRCGSSRLMHSVRVPNCFPGQPFRYRVRTLQVNRTAVLPASNWSAELTAAIPTLAAEQLQGSAPSASASASAPPDAPLDVGVIADMDFSNGSAIGAVAAMVDAARLDLVFHAGDIAYNLDDNCGDNGDAFFRALQPVSTRVPYHLMLGDHEAGRKYDVYGNQVNGFDYESFMNRLGQATNGGQLWLARKSLSTSLHFYSWEARLTHFVFLQTNCYVHQHMYWLLPIQFGWLQRDLAAVDRKRTPWVVVVGHRSMYCRKTDDDECNAEAFAIRYGVPEEAYARRVDVDAYPLRNVTSSAVPRRFGLEKLFRQYGVDLYVAGHTHHYERSWPVFDAKTQQKTYVNPSATVYLTAGAAGNVGADPFVSPVADWEAFRDEQLRRGYGHLRVHNKTHLTYMQRLNCDGEGSGGGGGGKMNDVYDSFTIVKTEPDNTYDEPNYPQMYALLFGIGFGIPVVCYLLLWIRSKCRDHSKRERARNGRGRLSGVIGDVEWEATPITQAHDGAGAAAEGGSSTRSVNTSSSAGVGAGVGIGVPEQKDSSQRARLLDSEVVHSDGGGGGGGASAAPYVAYH